MTEENQKPENEELQEDISEENQTVRKNSKEMWLFLIIIDIIALGVFGFFIYRAFFSPAAVKPAEEFMQEVLVEDIKPLETPASPDVQAAAPAKEDAKETVKEEVKEAAKPAAEVSAKDSAAAKPADTQKAQPAKKETDKAAKKDAPKKQSVFISGSGKWRKVTFKYYGAGKKVSVVGGFTMRKNVAMKKDGGAWSVTLTIAPGEYKYMFIVDGKETADPNVKQDGGKSVVRIK